MPSNCLGAFGQPVSECRIPRISSSTATDPSAFRSDAEHCVVGHSPCAIRIAAVTSATVTNSSPLQSPGQPDPRTGGVGHWRPNTASTQIYATPPMYRSIGNSKVGTGTRRLAVIPATTRQACGKNYQERDQADHPNHRRRCRNACHNLSDDVRHSSNVKREQYLRAFRDCAVGEPPGRVYDHSSPISLRLTYEERYPHPI